MNVGILELAHAGMAGGVDAAIKSVVETARLAAGEGLRRLWFPEHHDPGFLAATPDLLCLRVAPDAPGLRLGVAGVLLRVHAPWAVAERWAMVSHMTPAGLDLGIARGDVDAHRAAALRDGMTAASPAEFEGRVAALLSYLQGDVGPALHPPPSPDVDVWLHGRHRASADVAGRFGLAYCHARFLGEPSPAPAGTRAVALAGVCAPSQADANEWASSDLAGFRPSVVGDRGAWARELASLRERDGVAEIVFVDLCRSPAHHLRSIAFLTEVAAAQ